MADVPQLEDPRGDDLKSDAKLIGINFRALRDDLQANSTFAVQELVNATGAVNLTNSDVQVESVSCTLPTGWRSMDVLLYGKCQIVSTTGTDHRVDVWLESPSTTLLNAKATCSIISTGTFANEQQTQPLSGLLTNLSAAQNVLIRANITGGSTTSGDCTATNRHLMALKIRRS